MSLRRFVNQTLIAADTPPAPVDIDDQKSTAALYADMQPYQRLSHSSDKETRKNIISGRGYGTSGMASIDQIERGERADILTRSRTDPQTKALLFRRMVGKATNYNPEFDKVRTSGMSKGPRALGFRLGRGVDVNRDYAAMEFKKHMIMSSRPAFIPEIRGPLFERTPNPLPEGTHHLLRENDEWGRVPVVHKTRHFAVSQRPDIMPDPNIAEAFPRQPNRRAQETSSDRIKKHPEYRIMGMWKAAVDFEKTGSGPSLRGRAETEPRVQDDSVKFDGIFDNNLSVSHRGGIEYQEREESRNDSKVDGYGRVNVRSVPWDGELDVYDTRDYTEHPMDAPSRDAGMLTSHFRTGQLLHPERGYDDNTDKYGAGADGFENKIRGRLRDAAERQGDRVHGISEQGYGVDQYRTPIHRRYDQRGLQHSAGRDHVDSKESYPLHTSAPFSRRGPNRRDQRNDSPRKYNTAVPGVGLRADTRSSFIPQKRGQQGHHGRDFTDANDAYYGQYLVGQAAGGGGGGPVARGAAHSSNRDYATVGDFLRNGQGVENRTGGGRGRNTNGFSVRQFHNQEYGQHTTVDGRIITAPDASTRGLAEGRARTEVDHSTEVRGVGGVSRIAHSSHVLGLAHRNLEYNDSNANRVALERNPTHHPYDTRGLEENMRITYGKAVPIDLDLRTLNSGPVYTRISTQRGSRVPSHEVRPEYYDQMAEYSQRTGQKRRGATQTAARRLAQQDIPHVPRRVPQSPSLVVRTAVAKKPPPSPMNFARPASEEAERIRRFINLPQIGTQQM